MNVTHQSVVLAALYIGRVGVVANDTLITMGL